MSWTVSYPEGVSLENLVDDLQAGTFNGQAGDPVAQDQAEVAKASAFAIIAAGTVGEHERYGVTLSGHSTGEDLKFVDGQGAPFVSVHVTALRPKVVAESDGADA